MTEETTPASSPGDDATSDDDDSAAYEARLEKRSKALEKELDLLKQKRQALLDEEAGTRKLSEAYLKQIKVELELLEVKKLQGPVDAQLIEDLEKLEQQIIGITEAQQKADDRFAAGALTFNELSGKYLEVGGILGRLKGALDAGSDGFLGFKERALDSINTGDLFINMSLKMAQATVDFALEQDKVISNFRRQTGAGDEFNDAIRDSERRLFAMGVSLEDAANATQALKNTFVDFTYLSDSARDSVQDQTLMLEKLGMAQQTSAQIYQMAGESMNMSVEESNQLLLDLTSTARSLGVDVDKMGQEFLTNKEFIVSFGKDGSKVFEEMAVQAKSLGMELGTLTGVVDKFTTFDQAGKSVGRLNAILGGPFLNSIDMLNAAMEDPAEAVNMLRDSFDQAGVSIEDMGRAEKMAFASALGMSIEDMTNMLGQSREEMEITRLEQEELAAQSAATQDITTKLSSAMRLFYLNLGPLVDAITPLIDKLGSVAQAMGNFLNTGKGIPIFMGLMGALGGIGIGMALGLAKALQAATAAIPGVGPAMAKIQAIPVKRFTAKALAYAAMGGLAGGLLGGITGAAVSSGIGKGGEEKTTKPRFANGGMITTEQAIVHPGEMLITGGQGSEVISQKDFKKLLAGLKNLTEQGNPTSPPIQLDVYIGREKIDEIVVNALNSPAGKRALSPYAG